MTQKPHQVRRRKILLAVLYGCIGLTVVGLVFTVLSIFGLVDAIRQSQKTNSGINSILLDCTDPDGKCAKENQHRIAGAVDNIGRLSVYASACAADVDPALPVRKRVADIESCVRQLAERPPQ